MKALGATMTSVVSQFPDPGVNFVFLSSHDVSRLRSVTASDSVAYNALVWQFMFDGIPCHYYGEHSRLFFVKEDVLIEIPGFRRGTGDHERSRRPGPATSALGIWHGRIFHDDKNLQETCEAQHPQKIPHERGRKACNRNARYPHERSLVVLSSQNDLVFIKVPVIVVLNNVSTMDSPTEVL